MLAPSLRNQQLARLLVMSYGEKQLTRERWQQLLQMEHTREARLRVVG